jgi:hypothetical protein
MRREPEFFEEGTELILIYIAKRLKEALALEALFTEHGLDYVVEPDQYTGGIIFRTERTGAFFYVPAENEANAKELMAGGSYKALN